MNNKLYKIPLQTKNRKPVGNPNRIQALKQMRKIILSAIALLTLSATSCQKKNEVAQKQEDANPPKLTKISDELTISEMHNLVIEAYADKWGLGSDVGIDSTFSRVVMLNDSLFGYKLDQEDFDTYKEVLVSKLTGAGAINEYARFYNASISLPALAAMDLGDTILKPYIVVFMDSLLNNPIYGRTAGIDAIDAITLTGYDAECRDYFSDVFRGSMIMYGDPINSLWAYGSTDHVATLDAAGALFGAGLANSYGIRGAGRAIIIEMMSAAFSAQGYE